MSVLILYTTKSGACRECAECLAKRLGDCAVADLAGKIPDVGAFDTIVVGSGVRFGRFYKPAAKFLRQNADLLCQKRLAIFLCNGEPASTDSAVEKNIPQALRDHAVCIESLGGKMPFRAAATGWMRLEGVEKLVSAVLASR